MIYFLTVFNANYKQNGKHKIIFIFIFQIMAVRRLKIRVEINAGIFIGGHQGTIELTNELYNEPPKMLIN